MAEHTTTRTAAAIEADLADVLEDLGGPHALGPATVADLREQAAELRDELAEARSPLTWKLVAAGCHEARIPGVVYRALRDYRPGVHGWFLQWNGRTIPGTFITLSGAKAAAAARVAAR